MKAMEEVVGMTDATVELVAAATLLVAGLLLTPLPSYVETELGPVGSSPERTHPVFAVSAAGHSTCTKSTVGLLAPSNQSYRQSHPG